MFKGKVALVTGASRGIGHAIALELGKQGATVIGTATTQEGADRITAAFATAKINGKGLALNVTDQTSIDNAMKAISDEFSVPAILVNNAGITRDNIMLRMKEEEWQSIIDTNLTAIFRMSKACLKGMVKARWGRIISIGSVIGTMGNSGQANYAAAKAGLVGFSKSLAREIGVRGVTVNVVAPGFIETDMTDKLTDDQKEMIFKQIPLARLGQCQDIAAAVSFLASDQAGYITGETLNVNGGMYMV